MTEPYARLAISAWRNDDVFEFPLRVVGLDPTALTLAMQVRLAPDTPGAPLIDLAKVTNGNQQGLRVTDVALAGSTPGGIIRIRINKSTLQALPYSGELGSPTILSYALLIAGRTRLVGEFQVLPSTYGSDAAPANRPAGYGSPAGTSGASGGAVLTIAADGGATLTIDGADLVDAIAATAQAAADAAVQAQQGAEAAQAAAAGVAYQQENAIWGVPDLNPAGATPSAGQTAYIRPIPLPRGIIEQIEINALAGGGTPDFAFVFRLVTLTADLKIASVIASHERLLPDGVSSFTAWNPEVAADNVYLEVLSKYAFFAPRYAPTGGRTLTGPFTGGDGVGTQMSYTDTDVDLLVRVKIRQTPPLSVGTELRDASRSISFRGATPGGSAAANGAALRDALLAVDAPRVPTGTFAIDGVPMGSFWGTGRLVDAGGRIYLPPAPRDLNFRRLMRTLLMQVSALGGVISLVGDSISANYTITGIAGHWFELFRQAAVGDVDPLSETGAADFGAQTSLYGITYNGGGEANTGPIGRARSLPAGASISFTGAYANIAFLYDRAPGAGTLTLTRAGGAVNGGAINTAGAAATDVPSGLIATGTAAVDTYTLTASGGPVVLTHLDRLGSRVAGTKAPFFRRMALLSRLGAAFAQEPALTSVIAQASTMPAGGTAPGLIFLAVGTNDGAAALSAQTPADFRATLEKIFARALSAGHCIVKIGIMQSTIVPVAGYTYDDYVATEIAACRRYGVPYWPGFGIDMLGRGLMPDGTHPSLKGQELMFRSICEFLAGGALDLLAQQVRMLGRIDVAGSGAPALLALTGSTYRRTDGGAGTSLYVQQATGYANGWAPA